MGIKNSIKHFLFLGLIFIASKTFGQAASGIGLAYGPSKPLSGDYKLSSGVQLFSDIAISSRWEIVPNIGVEALDSKGRVYVVNPYYSRHIEDIGMIYAGASAKYNFSRNIFVKAGPMLFIGAGGDDISAGGIGGTAAAGYNLNLDEHSTLELSVFTSVVNIEKVGNGITAVAGLKLGYVFNFSRRK
ncbi:MAG TPA: hypothetical protein VIM55_06650 [Mucilaginibacter sp.]